jgi:HD-like signal output (HDOD) protein
MIQGELQTLPLSDLIQWLALTRRTGKLALTQADIQSLLFYFAEGKIAGACAGEPVILGDEEKIYAALDLALAWRSGSFAWSDGALPLQLTASNLRLSAERLLLQQQAGADSDSRDWDDAAVDYSDTFTLADSLRLQVIDRLLREDFIVPVMPQLAVRVLELTRDEDFSLRDLGNLILTDQAIAARLLRYANSAFHSSERGVDSLALAVQRLGADEVVNIVLAATLQTRRLGTDHFAAEKQRLNQQAAVAAFFARALAARASLHRGLGFLCGLLMDFGTNVLYSIIQQVLSQRESTQAVPRQVIEEVVRDYHPRVGHVVGEKWRLPTPVIETMAYHHCQEELIAEKPYVAVAALADALATFVLSVPRAELEAALPVFLSEQFGDLNASEAGILLNDLLRSLDQALEFVID